MSQATSPSSSSPNPNHFLIAVVTVKERTFPEIRRYLAPTFRTIHASTAQEIQAAVNDSGIHGLVFDLDSIGEGAEDGIEVLEAIRKLREDLVLVAMTESTDGGLSLLHRRHDIGTELRVPVEEQEPLRLLV